MLSKQGIENIAGSKLYDALLYERETTKKVYTEGY